MNYLGILDTLLLFALLVHQVLRSRLLAESMKAQARLITETKDVVAQQATAITSQAQVVSTALKYTEAFDAAKFEALVRREATLEYRDQLQKLEETLSTERKQRGAIAGELLEQAVRVSVNRMMAFIDVPLRHYFDYISAMPPEERERLIASIPDELLRGTLQTTFPATQPTLPAASAGTTSP